MSTGTCFGQLGFAPLKKKAMSSAFSCHRFCPFVTPSLSPVLAAFTISAAMRIWSLSRADSFLRVYNASGDHRQSQQKRKGKAGRRFIRLLVLLELCWVQDYQYLEIKISNRFGKDLFFLTREKRSVILQMILNIDNP